MNYKKVKIAAEIITAISIDIVLLGSLYFKPLYFSEKIEDQKKLERVINEEKYKLGLNDVIIKSSLDLEDTACYADSCRIDENEFEIYIARGNTRDIVKHELYHIYRMKQQGCDGWKKRKYNLVEEPLAILYGTTGIKL